MSPSDIEEWENSIIPLVEPIEVDYLSDDAGVSCKPGCPRKNPGILNYLSSIADEQNVSTSRHICMLSPRWIQSNRE